MADVAISQDCKNSAKLALYYLALNRSGNDLVATGDVWYEKKALPDGTATWVPVYPTFSEDGNTIQEYRVFEEEMEKRRGKGETMKLTRKQKVDLGGSVVHIDPSSKDEHMVKVKVNGQDKLIIINGNPRAAQAINGKLGLDSNADDIEKLLMKALRWMASVSTSYSPEFWISNLQRDMLYSIMATTIKDDGRNGAAFRRNLFTALKALTAGGFSGKYRKGSLGDSEMEIYYREFAQNGGITGWSSISNNEEWEQRMKMAAGEEKKGLAVITGVLDTFGHYGECVENAVRFAAYITYKQRVGGSTPSAPTKRG